MARIDISGIGIEYELIGAPGMPAVAITPGGRFSKDARGLREMAEAFAANGRRVLLWDRPNCGASDLCFEGEHEALLQARTLTQLVRKLELGRTVIAGGSAGARASMIAAKIDPDIVSHLVQWWITGGPISLMSLASNYYAESASTALRFGMAAVAELPVWSQQLKRNPKNRDILLQQDQQQFIATMERWASAFIPSAATPIPGMTRDEMAALKMPVLIFCGSARDLSHPEKSSREVHALIPHSVFAQPAWDDNLVNQHIAEHHQQGMGFSDWPLLVPQILEFTRQ